MLDTSEEYDSADSLGWDPGLFVLLVRCIYEVYRTGTLLVARFAINHRLNHGWPKPRSTPLESTSLSISLQSLKYKLWKIKSHFS